MSRCAKVDDIATRMCLLCVMCLHDHKLRSGSGRWCCGLLFTCVGEWCLDARGCHCHYSNRVTLLLKMGFAYFVCGQDSYHQKDGSKGCACVCVCALLLALSGMDWPFP